MISILNPHPHNSVVMCMVWKCRAFLSLVEGWVWRPMRRISKNLFSVCKAEGTDSAATARNSGRFQTRAPAIYGFFSRRSASICTGICATVNACIAACGAARARAIPSCRSCKACMSSVSCTPGVFSAGAEANRASCMILKRPVVDQGTWLVAVCAYQLFAFFPRHCRIAAGWMRRRQCQPRQRKSINLCTGKGTQRLCQGLRQS